MLNVEQNLSPDPAESPKLPPDFVTELEKLVASKNPGTNDREFQDILAFAVQDYATKVYHMAGDAAETLSNNDQRIILNTVLAKINLMLESGINEAKEVDDKRGLGTPDSLNGDWIDKEKKFQNKNLRIN